MMSNVIRPFPQYLWFLMMSFTIVIMMSNWFDPRLISLFGFVTTPGTLIFPLTYLLSDLITEVYGYKHARRAIWAGFLFNFVFIAFGQIVTHLPSPAFATQNAAFGQVFTSNIQIIIGSALSYLIAEPLNAIVMAKLKLYFYGRYMGVRFVVSTVFAAGLDSFLFMIIAFYGVLSTSQIVKVALTVWFIKVVIEVIGLPISIRLAKKLKKEERLDMFDGNTTFNLFRLEANYDGEDNAFKG